MKVIITKVWRGEADTKFGKKNTLAIKTDSKLDSAGSTTDKWISFMYGKDDGGTSKWTDGMEVDITVEKSGDYFNFTPAGFVKGGSAGIQQLVDRITKLEEAVFGKPKATKKAKEVEEDEVDIDFD